MPVETPLPVKPSTIPTSTAEVPARTEIQALYDQYVVPLANRGLTLTKGKGRYAWDDQGKKYLDLGGGVAVNSLGHAHPAIRDTLARRPTCSSTVAISITTSGRAGSRRSWSS